MKLRLLGEANACLYTTDATLGITVNSIIARLVFMTVGCLMIATVNAASVQRFNLDGSGRTPLVTSGLIMPRTIALDLGGVVICTGQILVRTRSSGQALTAPE